MPQSARSATWARKSASDSSPMLVQDVLGQRLADAVTDPPHFGPRERDGEEVVQLVGVAAGGQVIGVHRGVQVGHQFAHGPQEIEVDGR